MGLLAIPLIAAMLALGSMLFIGSARAVYRGFEAINDREHGHPNNMKRPDIVMHLLLGTVGAWFGGGSVYYAIIDTTYQLVGHDYSIHFFNKIFGNPVGSIF